MSSRNKDKIRQNVRGRYAGIAEGKSCSCCSAPQESAKLGYTEQDLRDVPEGSDMGLGCGNPQAIAALRPGETVLDLGCGGGFDCFLAARQVGDSGLVIGIDMTAEMISKARANAEKCGARNVSFRLGEIEYLPVADSSVDVIISNCVINLSPDKEQVFAEAFRVLKPGGRLAISDVVAVKPLPENTIRNMDQYCGCVSGAMAIAEQERILRKTGFTSVKVTPKPESREFIHTWFPGTGIEDCVLSADITAVKSGGK
ncbi:MAG TPA: arsenite methyltransferase [Kiritimatiellia bacterium]|nr:arsenite methyltransferase [Kiritimatiellia bacterium]HNR93485.1 arsenite methyltransferase [Kiritimatiellia bacterium]HNS80989.1 arsenite methyltransferase [Kiritimatiellia bacterium]HPA78015.1 arsenite methyltransferase [Kiritimatiellia bacterium]HQQ04399.1 arsenite methyltransferase [Kiritimatiellia bacterium]